MSDHVVVQPFYSNPTGALEVRAATATLPDPEELANAEGRAERYEAETMRLQTTVAEVLETLRLEQDAHERTRIENKYLRARNVELTAQAAEALRLKDIAEEENRNLGLTNARLREDVLALGDGR
jgi:hypothetical protein